MVSYVSNPPDALSLMTSARSFGNYDLASALADLIDNSLKAKAHNIRIYCLFQAGMPRVHVIDDGHGMSDAELRLAMRPASQNPLEERSPDDLGRFGWGLKSASFSQCKKLTVISTREGVSNGAFWDLDSLDGWRMGILSPEEISEAVFEPLSGEDGTEIIWDKCDRLSENGTISEDDFNAQVAYARNRLALIFHKYLSGMVRGRRLAMKMNGSVVEAFDPFYVNHAATQTLEKEDITVNGRKIAIQPYILPHYSKLKLSEHDRLGGEEGFLKNQGFYVYRNHRLIISGTWFRLARFGELSQLVRISIEIPNSLDDLWKITVDKSDAQLPTILRDRLKQLIERFRGQSSRVHRSRGGRLSAGGRIAVWDRYAKDGEIHYFINRDHPLVAAMLEGGAGGEKESVEAAFQAIEQGFPVEAFGRDTVARPNDIHQTEGDLGRFRTFLEKSLPTLLAAEDGDFRKLKEKLRQTEPYCSNWNPVEEYLMDKGWV